MDEVALGQVFLLVLLLSPVSIIPPMLHTYLHEYVALTGRRNSLRLGTFQKMILFRQSGSIEYKSTHTQSVKGSSLSSHISV
jgi:hypothetical protein